jgi:hypothetical protein
MEKLNSNINQTNGNGESNEDFPPPPDYIEYENGDFYIGETLNGTIPHGIGAVYDKNKNLVMYCKWENGVPVLEPLNPKYKS